jgi:hypothetical protein
LAAHDGVMAKVVLILILAWTAVDQMASSNSAPPLLIDATQPLDAAR